jgi:hypothetical protein
LKPKVSAAVHRHLCNFVLLIWRDRERQLGYHVGYHYSAAHKRTSERRFRLPVGKRTERALSRGTTPAELSARLNNADGTTGSMPDSDDDDDQLLSLAELRMFDTDAISTGGDPLPLPPSRRDLSISASSVSSTSTLSQSLSRGGPQRDPSSPPLV